MSLKIKTSWDLSPLLKSDNDPQAEEKLKKIKQAHETFIKKWKSSTKYLENIETLKEVLDDFEEINRKYGSSGDVGYYFSLKHYINQADPNIKAKLNKIEEFEKTAKNEIRFFILALAKISPAKQKEFLNAVQLKEYKHFLEKIFESSKHLLSENEEKIITLKQSVANDGWERMTQGILTKQEKEIILQNKKQKKNFSEILSLIENKDKQTRDNAAKALNEILVQCSDIAEAEMNAILANKKIDDELRSFSRPDSARHLEDDIPTEVVETLIKTISENFRISREFYKLKAKLFKVPKLHYYERAVPYGEPKELYTYENALNLVHKTMLNLDKEFADILEGYLKNGQVDAFPKSGKRNGAFCIHLLPIQPTYLLLNFDGSLHDVTTIAHELGHGINAELMNKTQNSLNLGTPKSTAEVASTFMEDFVLEELLKEADDQTKLEILMEKLNGDVSSIFRQAAFYNFETELHNTFREKGYLSKEEIGLLFKKHMNAYMGEAVDTSQSDNWWIYVPHFRDSFYVYSYASGLLISKSLQESYRKNNSFIERVKEFLSAGTSDSPKNIFESLEIDITDKKFWLQGVQNLEKTLKHAEDLAKKLKKI